MALPQTGETAKGAPRDSSQVQSMDDNTLPRYEDQPETITSEGRSAKREPSTQGRAHREKSHGPHMTTGKLSGGNSKSKQNMSSFLLNQRQHSLQKKKLLQPIFSTNQERPRVTMAQA